MNIYAAFAGLTTLFVSLTFLSFIVDEGISGLVTTTLSASVTKDATTLLVTSTSGFLAVDYVFVESEKICHTGKTATSLTGLTRGCRGSKASTHSQGSRVYNETTGVLNEIVGYNVAEVMSTAGPFKAITLVPSMLGHAIPKLIGWDYAYLEGDLFGLPLAYLKYFILYPISAAFSIGLLVILINIFMGVAGALNPFG